MFLQVSEGANEYAPQSSHWYSMAQAADKVPCGRIWINNNNNITLAVAAAAVVRLTVIVMCGAAAASARTRIESNFYLAACELRLTSVRSRWILVVAKNWKK